MFRIFLGFIALLFAHVTFAQDVSTADAVIERPWKVTLSTETSMQLGQETAAPFVSELNQETALSFTYKLGASGYSVNIRQPFYNTFLETGVNDVGSFYVGDTELNLKKASIGTITPSDVKLGAGLRVVLPTDKITPSQSDSGFLAYFAPSISAIKNWTRLTLGTTLASRFYLFSKEAYPIYSFEDREATTRTVVIESYANPITRQIIQGILGYKITEKVGLGTVAQLELDWRHDPKPNQPAKGAPRFMLIPEVTYSPLGAVELAAGVVVGGSSYGARKLRDVWFNNQDELLTSSTAYANVSYTF
ncbi:MAG: hypothetical protein A3F16_01560 [Deltaproteobacteria bacterium RIFCSPHIGHO2_12_FULL_43_9]|nr:MAG: hypothetical protein A3F16_01560 [Deltaproteobacteria bacterium RIFCSPHIGHO2_12_FULL_43_9]